jgi:hypothetical protein
MEVVDGLAEQERAWAMESVGRSAEAVMYQRGKLVPLLEASARSGSWEVLDRALENTHSRNPPDSPQIYLNWAFGAEGPADDPVAIRHAVGLALRSDREATLEWIARMENPAMQRRAQLAVEGR